MERLCHMTQPLFLFEIEGEHNHLAMGRRYTLGIAAEIHVLELITMLGVKAVAQTIAELQLGAEFEERKLEVAPQSYLYHRVETLETHIILRLARQVNHRVDAGDDIGTVVVETLCAELQIDREGDIGVL